MNMNMSKIASPAAKHRILVNRLVMISLDSLSSANKGNPFMSRSEVFGDLNRIRATKKRIFGI